MSERTDRLDFHGLFGHAVGQLGYFTADQASQFGISLRLLAHHTAGGRFIRAARGVYRFRDFPDPPSDLPVVWLSIFRLTGGRAAISHESALYVHQLSDLVPRAIDVLVPRTHKDVRVNPALPIRLHSTVDWPRLQELQQQHGVLVTSPIRTIFDCLQAGTEAPQVARAIEQVLERGWTTAEDLLDWADRRGGRPAHEMRGFLHETAGSAPW